MADFEPGSRVVCVLDRWHVPEYWPPLLLPEVGREYIVRTFGLDEVASQARREIIGPGLRFHWLINPKILIKGVPTEPSFALFFQENLNFRPVIERKTDISEFEKLLLTKDVRVPETV